MRTWSDLKSEFTELHGAGPELRLDHQTGGEREWWMPTGGPPTVPRFEALASMAGAKLLEVPTSIQHSELAEERSDVFRWYRALKLFSGSYRYKGYATSQDQSGTQVYMMASVESVCSASATLCLQMESASIVAVPRLETLCSVPRYAGPCRQWRAARASLASAEPDHASAARAAVAAVEGLCRVISKNESLVLGDAIKALRHGKQLHGALLKCLEGLWGYSSATPGVRHGAGKDSRVDASEALFVVEASEAALRLLLAKDDGSLAL